MKIKEVNKNKCMKILSTSLIFLFLVALSILPASAALQQVSTIATPPGLNFAGIPNWYQDTTGLALQPCLGINPDGTGLQDPNCVAAPKEIFITNPLAVPPTTKVTFDPALPISFPGNYPQEVFYMVADAVDAGGAPLRIGTVGAKAAFRIALEEAFLGTADANGIIDPAAPDTQKITFLRVNFRVNQVGGTNGLTPGSTYTITHPFGSFTCITDVNGDIANCPGTIGGGVDFRAQDGGLAGGDFVSLLPATTTKIGPFLKAVSPAPPVTPPGYIGNPLVAQTITGGLTGIYSITGPNVDGLGGNIVSTNLWHIAGKKAVIDAIPPLIGATTTTPAPVIVGTTNVVASVNVTDNLFVGSVTVDLGPVGSNFTATMNAAQEVPPTGSTSTGTGTFTIDTTLKTLSFNVTWSGPAPGDTETTAHIHGPAAVGVSAPPVFNLPSPGLIKTGVWPYGATGNPLVENDILAGKMYVNVHTALFPNGAIRGQILPASDVRNMLLTSPPNPLGGTFSIIIPIVSRAGTFNLPVVASDGTNIANGNLVLNVVSPLASVSVAPATANVAAGKTLQLTATPLNQTGAPFVGATINWTSSNTAVATVDLFGLVKGVSVGAATITAIATGAGTSVTGTSAITVVPLLNAVNVTPATASLVNGSQMQLTAMALDPTGAPLVLQPAITWTSSNPPVAAVSPTGLVTAGLVALPVTVTITASATDGGVTVTGTSVLTVTPPQILTSVVVAPASVNVGGTMPLTALPKDQFGNAFVGATINWTSSNISAVAVDPLTGIAKGVALGTAIITANATNGTKSVLGTATITVANLTSVVITPASASVIIGRTMQLTASPKDQNGAPFLGATIVWASNNISNATVSPTGLVTGVALGTATINATATSGTISLNGTATITVVPVPPATIGSGSSGGGGGGGGGVTSAEDFANVEKRETREDFLRKDVAVSYKIVTPEIPVKEMVLTANLNAGSVAVQVELLKDKSKLVTKAPVGMVYKYVNMWVGTSGFGTSKNIKEGVVKFRVENTWLDSNKVASADIRLMRWDGKDWAQLPTEEKMKDATHTYFEAKTNMFSPFVVASMKPIPSAAPPVVTPTQTQPKPPATPMTTAAPKETEAPKGKVPGFEAIIAIVTLSALYLLRKRR